MRLDTPTAAHIAPAAGAPPARIRVTSLTKRFRRADGEVITPVNDISLDVGEAELVVLLGPSGCGKTTLLRCVAGLERPDAGEIHINGQLVFSSARGISVPPEKRPVSMVFQSYALWPHMTVFENVAYPLHARGVMGAETERRVTEVLDTVGLAGLRGQHPGQLSGGQQQRVALARAVVAQTGVVLFDEPLSNVDAKVREQLRFEIRRMQRTFGFSALYVTHDQGEAMALADRIAVLDNGVVAQLGSAEQIYDRPTSLHVGTFIGTANLWPGRVLSADGPSARIVTAFGDMEVADARLPHGAPVVAGDAVTVLTRPETLRLVTQPEPDSWPCIVEMKVYLGTHTEYVVALGEERVRIWAPNPSAVPEGASAWVIVPPAAPRLVRG
jgi:ABC-type Fe3+/spermidine/putrescine transport system ATPase subunit